MSIEAVSWALGVPVGGNEKVMLLGLANHAHPDGSNAYPALGTTNASTAGRAPSSGLLVNVRPSWPKSSC